MNKFTILGDQLTGYGLSFDITMVTASGSTPEERGARLVEIGEAIFRQARIEMLSLDDRFDLQGAIEALRALSVVVGPGLTGERHRRVADILARLLQEQEMIL